MNQTPAPVWRGRLPELLPHLTEQLATVDRPKVQLPHGAYLSLSRRPNGQRVLRIARAVKPASEKGYKMWRLELDTFRKHLGLEGWAQAGQSPIAGVAAAFVEPAQEEGAVSCDSCRFDVDWLGRLSYAGCVRCDHPDWRCHRCSRSLATAKQRYCAGCRRHLQTARVLAWNRRHPAQLRAIKRRYYYGMSAAKRAELIASNVRVRRARRERRRAQAVAA